MFSHIWLLAYLRAEQAETRTRAPRRRGAYSGRFSRRRSRMAVTWPRGAISGGETREADMTRRGARHESVCISNSPSTTLELILVRAIFFMKLGVHLLEIEKRQWHSEEMTSCPAWEEPLFVRLHFALHRKSDNRCIIIVKLACESCDEFVQYWF